MELCSSSLHSFPLLRVWLWNIMQMLRKLYCVVRFFVSYSNCLAVHLRRFESNCVLSEQLGVKSARKRVWWRVRQCREQFGLEIYVAKRTGTVCLSSCAWQAHSSVSAAVHGRHTEGSRPLQGMTLLGNWKFCNSAFSWHSGCSDWNYFLSSFIRKYF